MAEGWGAEGVSYSSAKLQGVNPSISPPQDDGAQHPRSSLSVESSVMVKFMRRSVASLPDLVFQNKTRDPINCTNADFLEDEKVLP